MFRCFISSDFKYDYERQAFKTIFESLKGRYSSKEDVSMNLVVQPHLFSLIPDFIIISNSLIGVADIKMGFGKVEGNENGSWFASGIEVNKGRENPFKQIHKYKFELLNFLKDRVRAHFTPEFIDSNLNLGHIRGFLIFDSDIQYDHSQLSETTQKWFKVTSVNKFCSEIESLPMSSISLKNEDVDTLLFKIMGLHPNQAVESYKERVVLEVKEYTSRDINIPFEIPDHSSLPENKKILNYYRYCLTLEDIKLSEISPNKFLIELPEEPFSLKSFKLEMKKDMERYLKDIMTYSRVNRPQLIMAFPVVSVNEKEVPIFLFYLDFEFENEKDKESGKEIKLVKFRIVGGGEVSKLFITRVLGITDPEEIEAVKMEIDLIDGLEDKRKAILSNLNPERAKVPPDSIKGAFESKVASIFFSRGGINSKAIKELKSISDDNLNTSLFLNFVVPFRVSDTEGDEDITLFPFSELNAEQKLALKSAFRKRLTVITGPPGTGKTQVSLNILANAVLNGKTVLFSTKNNKAVDDVCKKFESLFPRDFLIPYVRVGNMEVMSQLSEKIKFAIGFLEKMKRPTQSEIDTLELELSKLKSRIENLEDRISKIEELKAYLDNLRDNLRYLEELKEFRISNKEEILRELIDKKNHLLSKISEPFLDFLYHKGKKFVVDRSTITYYINTLKDKLNGNLSFFERLFSLFVKDYIERKYRKIFNRLTESLEPVLVKYLEESYENISDLFESLLRVKDWEEAAESAIKLDGEIKRVKEELEELKKQFNLEINSLKIEIKKREKEVEEGEKNLSSLKEYLEMSNEELVMKAKEYLTLKYLSRLSPSLVPSLQCLLKQVEDGPIRRTHGDCFDDVLKVFPVFATTNLSVSNAVPLEPELFDILVIDEASQSDIPSALPLVLRCKSVVIIGDPMQLRHVSGIRYEEDKLIARKCRVEPAFRYSLDSLYTIAEHLSRISSRPVIFLREHYRSHPSIIEFSNRHFYSRIGKELIVKTPKSQIKFWLNGIYWIHTEGIEKDKMNEEEVNIIRELLLKINKLRDPNVSVGITTPFRNQADLLRSRLSDLCYPDLDVIDTVHRFQGDEKDVMILSLVVSPQSEGTLFTFINDLAKQLLNVAVTRAKSCLFVVGDYNCALSDKRGNFHYDYIRALAKSSTLLKDFQSL